MMEIIMLRDDIKLLSFYFSFQRNINNDKIRFKHKPSSSLLWRESIPTMKFLPLPSPSLIPSFLAQLASIWYSKLDIDPTSNDLCQLRLAPLASKLMTFQSYQASSSSQTQSSKFCCILQLSMEVLPSPRFSFSPPSSTNTI